VAQVSKETGRIGPDSGIQPSGRKLTPAGKLSPALGNLPAGGALTKDGRYLWTLSAGRGRNDIRIVRVAGRKPCAKGARGAACRRAASRVVQIIPMPGLSGGMSFSPDGRTAYVSGVPDSKNADQKAPAGTPGTEGDVVHVFTISKRTGKASRKTVIPVPAPSDAPIPQDFPPRTSGRQSWPRDIAVSPDGRTLLVALNLADRAAVVDVASKGVRYVPTGSYPYGAAISRDGKYGLVSNETPGTVSVIDIATAKKVKDLQVGPHLSHPEGIVADPKRDRAYVAVTNQDLVAVIDLAHLDVERTVSVGRPEGLGTAPVALSVSADGRRLLVADSGEDAIAVIALPGRPSKKASAAQLRADTIIRHEAARAAAAGESDEAEAEELATAAGTRRTGAWELVGRIPVAGYPVFAAQSSRGLVWLTAKGLGVGPNPSGPNPTNPDDTDDAQNRYEYLPLLVRGLAGVLPVPSDAAVRRLTPKASAQIRPVNGQAPPPGTPLHAKAGKIEHVFYVVRENRTYDQILGDDERGDGDPKLTLFGKDITPNAHALARRFPLLDHVYANSEASIDGHFWTSAAAVSDYVVKNWHQNYAGRKRPYDFGVYSVTWPAAGFLFDQAEKQGISWFNYGEAIAGTVPLADKDRTPDETQHVGRKFAKSDLGIGAGCFANDASSGGTDIISGQEVYDSSVPLGAKPGATSRFDCFKQRFTAQAATNSVPAFNSITLSNDHTSGTRAGARTPRAMVAENDYGLGQLVDLISKSNVWGKSLILVVEDDSQNGADHVDAHRIPALAISPYAKRGAVVHTRYDFLSFIRTLQLPIGMKPLNLFDALAVPLYDAFSADASNAEPYDAITPGIDLTERNGASAPGARLSKKLDIGSRTDAVPQRTLDEILWRSVHGAGAVPPPPGPNASAIDEEQARAVDRADGE
jgi:DNA-binding beta-propeller fold protein YncE